MKKFLISSLLLTLGLGVGRLGVAGPNCADENGDVNGDGSRDLSDAVYSLAFSFQGGPVPVDFCLPPGPKAQDCADMNGDDNGDAGIDLSDPVYLLAFLFQGGPPPVPKCEVTTEICDNNIDDDMDGDTDCDDPECAAAQNCGDPSTLPATGQTLCYEPVGCGPTDVAAELNCADDTLGCFGQDGFYQAGCPNDANRFVIDERGTAGDTSDDTVMDTCTGLMWQRDTADIGRDGDPLLPDGVVDEFDRRTWCDALSYCEGLSFATHDDWRLPNIRELYSILDHGKKNPSIDTAVFGVLLERYWSSTSVNFDPANAWHVSFNLKDRNRPLHNGELDRGSKGDAYLLRAVRGAPQVLPATGQTLCYDGAGVETDCAAGDCLGQDGHYAAQGVGCPNDAGRFSDNADGTVTDTCTNLTWQQDTADVTGDGMITADHFADRSRQCGALAYCEGLVLTTNNEFKDEVDLVGGDAAKYDDWRLPNLLELHSIVDYGRSNPAMSDVFGGWGEHDYETFGAPEYWSSSICGGPECVDQEPERQCGRGFVIIFGCCHEDTAPLGGRDDGGAVTMRIHGRDVYLRAVRGGL